MLTAPTFKVGDAVIISANSETLLHCPEPGIRPFRDGSIPVWKEEDDEPPKVPYLEFGFAVPAGTPAVIMSGTFRPRGTVNSFIKVLLPCGRRGLVSPYLMKGLR